MIKKSVTYKDLYGRHVTEDLYFHLSEYELVELQFSHENGWAEYIDTLVKSENPREAFAAMSNIVLTAYGEREEDGRGFRKNDAIRERFKNSLAFNEIVLGFLEDPSSGAEFVRGLVPNDIASRFQAIASSNEGENVDEKPVARLEPKDHLPKKTEMVSASEDADRMAFEEWKARQSEG